MGLIREPKNVDFSNKSEPWTEQELADFRKIIKSIKEKNVKRKEALKKRNSLLDNSTTANKRIAG